MIKRKNNYCQCGTVQQAVDAGFNMFSWLEQTPGLCDVYRAMISHSHAVLSRFHFEVMMLYPDETVANKDFLDFTVAGNKNKVEIDDILRDVELTTLIHFQELILNNYPSIIEGMSERGKVANDVMVKHLEKRIAELTVIVTQSKTPDFTMTVPIPPKTNSGDGGSKGD